MPLRQLLRMLINNEQLIEKLAESYPVRRAAQLTAHLMQRGNEQIERMKESDALNKTQAKIEQKVDQMDKKIDSTNRRAGNVVANFVEELEKEWNKEKKKIDSQYKDKEKK